MKKLSLILLLYLYLHVSAASAATTYTVGTFRRSHWALDPITGATLLQNNKPYRDPGDGIYNFQRSLDPAKTAIICMDCWRGMADPALEAYFHDIAVSKIYPFMLLAAQKGFRTIFLTNDPALNKSNYGVDLSLAPIIWNNGGIVLFHETFDNPANPLAFKKWLDTHGIDTLIYMGFASHVCVMYRLDGMVFMQRYFSRIYFVPEGSGAVENLDNWDGHIHENQTEIISKQFEIIHADDFMNALLLP